MASIKDFLSAFPSLSADQLNGLIALGGLAVAAFAIYAVLTVIKGSSR
jgi:hypothetical protein